MKNKLATALALTAACFLSGCVVMTGHHVEESGVRLSAKTLEQVEIGRTTEQWLLATLGEPSARTRVDEHVEILRYEYSRENTRGGHLLLLFGGMTHTKEARTTYFEVTDGIVTKYWSESGVASRPKKKADEESEDDEDAPAGVK